MLIIQTYLKECKYLLLYIIISINLTTIVVYTYNYEILYLISKPLIQRNLINQNFNFIFTDIFEAFKTYLLLSIFMGIHLNIPFLIWTTILFFTKAVYKFEYTQIYFILKFLIIFLITTNALFYLIIYPIIINFLLQYETFNNFQPMSIDIQLKLNEYLNVFLKLIYIYNITILLPWLLLFTTDIRWIFYKKYIYLLTLILLAIITPPDILSLILFIIPVCIILETTHLLKRITYL